MIIVTLIMIVMVTTTFVIPIVIYDVDTWLIICIYIYIYILDNLIWGIESIITPIVAVFFIVLCAHFICIIIYICIGIRLRIYACPNLCTGLIKLIW